MVYRCEVTTAPILILTDEHASEALALRVLRVARAEPTRVIRSTSRLVGWAAQVEPHDGPPAGGAVTFDFV